ncbi:MAG: hypothetical protein ABR936_07225 [Bacteroidota bacterium]|jgi:hypothetical protein
MISMEPILKNSKRGDRVLLRIADELHFGVVVYVSRYCPFSNRILRDGAIIGTEVPGLPKHQRIYFFEPFEP